MIIKIIPAAPVTEPIIIFTFLDEFFFGKGLSANGLSSDGVEFVVADVGGIPSSKLQLNVTLDMVTFAALTSSPGLQMLIGAQGGLGLNVYTLPVRSPSKQSVL